MDGQEKLLDYETIKAAGRKRPHGRRARRLLLFIRSRL